MKHTPLIEQHRAHGAKLVDFAGWEMPIQYASVVEEYHTVRSKAGLFDVSHMGRLTVAVSDQEFRISALRERFESRKDSRLDQRTLDTR